MSISEDSTFLHALQYIGGTVGAMTLNAALQLDFFGIIARAGHLSAVELASRLPRTTSDTAATLDRMLRLLTSHGFLTSSMRNDEDGSAPELVYGLSPASRYFSLEPNNGSLAYLHFLANHKLVVDTCAHMRDAIVGGGDQYKKINGKSMYEIMESDAALNETFINAMCGVSTLNMAKILEQYKGFEGLSTVVDVGGSTGKIISMIVSKYPSINGINFDLPHVIRVAPYHPGVTHIAGDMFESIPKGEAVILMEVLHNWKDDECVKILKNCHEALPEGGKVVVITLTMPEIPNSSNASKCIANMDYLMMLHSPGKERTEREYSDLCKRSGFSECLLAFVSYGIWSVLEFHKR